MKKQYFIYLLLTLFSAVGFSQTVLRIEAESYTSNSGAKAEVNAALSGTGNVGFIKNNTWIKFTGHTFSQYDNNFTIKASGATGGTIEFRLDSTTGTLIGTATVSGSTSFSDYKTFSTAISQTTGKHDLYLVFKHPTNTGYLFNIDYFEKITSDPNAATFTLTTNVSPASTGTISVNPGGTVFTQGTVVTLAAMDNFRYNFVQWVDENGAVVSTNSTLALTMNANTTRIAQFKAVTFPDIPSTQKLPNIPSTQFVITESKYGGSTSNLDNSAAINAAITAANAAGGGTVVVPAAASPFLSGPITMKSNVNLFISAGATLQLMPYGNGNGLPAGSYPNSGTADAYTTFIFGQNLSNIQISGTGTIEGNGSAWWTAFDATAIGRPGIIRFKACNTVLITDITIQNAPNVSITIGQNGNQGLNGTIKNVTVIAPSTAPNTDALDVWAWNGLDILNCYFSVGDDNVAVDANSQNVTVKNCSFGDGHGVSVGSYTSNVSNLIVDNCSFIGTSNGFRLKSNNTRGGGENSFTYTNVTMRNVSTPFAITSWYPKEPTAAPSTLVAGTVTSTTPAWKNITFKNITVINSDNAGIIYALPESFANSVVFDNVKISANKGMVANFVTGLVFQNCSSITIPSGAGNAIIPYQAETVSGSNIINGINTVSGASTSCNLSVEDISFSNKLSFYPNPVKGDNFTISTDSGIEKIVIYTLSGAKIKELNGNDLTQQAINVEGFSAGCYLVQIILENGKISTAKLVKE